VTQAQAQGDAIYDKEGQIMTSEVFIIITKILETLPEQLKG